MSKVTLQGKEISIYNELPAVGSEAPDFVLTDNELNDVNLSDYEGKKLVLNIFPSVDTGTCAASVREFNKRAAQYPNVEILCISEDLPFAFDRFCGAEGIDKVKTLSTVRTREFGKDYGNLITSGVLAGILSRAIVVLDENHNVIYTEQVPEITQEPDYDKALAALA